MDSIVILDCHTDRLGLTSVLTLEHIRFIYPKLWLTSSPEIEILIDAAQRAGARGAKLSGAGRGGNVIVLVDEGNREEMERALMEAGAVRVIVTRVE